MENLDVSAITSLVLAKWPHLSVYVGLITAAQLLASVAAHIPRLWGVKHATVWSRLMTAITKVHVFPPPAPLSGTTPPASTALPPKGKGSNAERGASDVVFLAFVAVVLGWIVLGTGCASLSRDLGNAPVQTACVSFKEPFVTADGRACTEVCVTTSPPSTTWKCTP